MKRLYLELLRDHLKRHRQMPFVAGPRQVGKTTCGKALQSDGQPFFYMNWDHLPHRQLLQSWEDFENHLGLNELRPEKILLVLDELHKYPKWKSLLKGFFDVYSDRVQIVVTGSAKMETYNKGGDSLMGRYLPYRMHPLSVGEILHPHLRDTELVAPQSIDQTQWEALNQFGGFPEPFLKREEAFSLQWNSVRKRQLFEEDLRDLTRIYEVKQVELLAEVLRHQLGQLTSLTSFANKVGVAITTIKHWLSALESLYYCFSLSPWSKNIARSLLKEKKYYLWDWSLAADEGAQFENLVASHLLKSVHYWNDLGMGEYELHFLRDKEKREVDFIVTKAGKPWFLVEVKLSPNNGISKSLVHFQKTTGAPHAFQVIRDLDAISMDCFSADRPVIVPARTFLSQLV